MNLTSETTGPEEEKLERLKELVRRAQEGDTSILPELRQFLDLNPSVWQVGGDLAVQAQGAWLRLLAPKDLLFRESVERKMDALRAELAGPSSSPLEGLLIERVVACWMQTLYADTAYAQLHGKQTTPAVRQELMRRQESSQRRYLAAIGRLAAVRKLLKPAPSILELMTRRVDEGTPARQGPTPANPPRRFVRSADVAEGEPVLN
jgi:hypothetical protein